MDPDPCVVSRSIYAEGDGHIVVKTTTFSVRNLAVAPRFDAGLSVSQAEGCPAMGASVTIIEG